MKIETLTIDSGGPITQSVDAVVGLLNSLSRPIEPLPELVDLGTVKLVLSNKEDVYYTTTARACSCPAATYRSGPCKHIRKHFPKAAEEGKPRRGITMAETLEENDRNLHRMPKSYQRMVRATREDAESEPSLISGGGFRPVLE